MPRRLAATTRSLRWLTMMLVSLLGLVVQRGEAQTSTFSPDAPGSYSWTDPGNWIGGVPNGINQTADIFGSDGVSQTLTLGSAITLGTIQFGGNNSHTIDAAGGSLVLDLTGTNTVVIAVGAGAGDQTINAPIVTNDNLSITQNSSGGGLTLGDITLSTARVITIGGVGNTTLGNVLANFATSANLTFNNTTVGTPGSLNITGGLSNGVGPNLTVTFNGSPMNTTISGLVSLGTGALHIRSGGTFRLDGGALLNTLSITSGTLYVNSESTLGVVTVGAGSNSLYINANTTASAITIGSGNYLEINAPTAIAGLLTNGISAATMRINSNDVTFETLGPLRNGTLQIGDGVTTGLTATGSQAAMQLQSGSGNHRIQPWGDNAQATYAGNINPNGNTGQFFITADTGQALTLSGTIGGLSTSGLVFTGGGTKVLTGTNSYTAGLMTASDGTTIFAQQSTYGGLVINSLGTALVTSASTFSSASVTGTLQVDANGADFGSSIGLNSTGRLAIGNGVTVNTPVIVQASSTGKVIAATGTAATLAGDITISVTTSGGFTVSAGSGQTLSLTGAIGGAGTGGLVKGGEGTVVLSGTNSYSAGTIFPNAGTLRITSSSTYGTLFGSGDGTLQLDDANTFSSIQVAANGILRLAGSGTLAASSATVTGTLNIDTNALTLSGITLTGSGTVLGVGDGITVKNAIPLTIGNTAGFKTLQAISGDTGAQATYAGNIVISAAANLFRVGAESGQTLSITGDIGGSGLAGITKIGLGTVVVAGPVSYTAAGITVGGGTLQLHYGSSTASKIADTMAITMTPTLSGAAMLELTGATSDMTETMGNLVLATAGQSTVRVTGASGATITLEMADIVPTDGLVRFETNAFGEITTTYATEGLLGGWARFNDGWAVATGTTTKSLGQNAFTVENNIANWVTGTNHYTNDGAAYNGALAGNTTIASLRFNVAADSTVDLGGNVLTISTGGILVTSAVGNHDTTISGGFLRPSGTSTDYYVYNDSTGILTIAATLSNSNSGTNEFQKSGTGVVVLSGTNAYNGTTIVNQGVLRVTGGSAIPDASDVRVSADATFELAANQTETIRHLTISSGTLNVQSGANLAANILSANGGTINLGSNAGMSASGNTTLDNTIIQVGSGATLNLAAVDFNTSTISVGAGGTLSTGNVVSMPAGMVELGNNATFVYNENGVLSQWLNPFELRGSTSSVFIKTGSGKVGIENQDNLNFFGSIIVNGGALNLGNDDARFVGGFQNTSGITVNVNGTLIHTGTGGPVFNRINDAATVTVNGGLFVLYNTDDAMQEMIDTLALSGTGHVTLTKNGDIARANSLVITHLDRIDNATLVLSGHELGGVGTGVGISTVNKYTRLAFLSNDPPSDIVFVGQSGLPAGLTTTTDLGVVAWGVGLSGNTTSSISADVLGAPSSFLTYDVLLTDPDGAFTALANGFRPLTNDEMAQYSDFGTNNVRITSSAFGLMGKTINSLVIDTSGSAFDVTGSGTLTIASGGILFTSTDSANGSTLGDFDSIAAGATYSQHYVHVYLDTATISSALASSSTGTADLIKSGTGTLVLTAANSYVGNTYVNEGVLRLDGGDNRLPTGTALTLSNGAQLDLFGNDQQLAGIYSNGQVKGAIVNNGASLATLTVNVGTGINDTYSGTLGGGSNTFDLVKSGAGALYLAGEDTVYTGVTTVSGGLLNVSGTLGAGGDIYLTGGTFASNGTVQRNVQLAGGTINLNGGTFTGTLNSTGGSWTGTGTVSGAVSHTAGTFNVADGGVMNASGNVAVAGGTFGVNGTINGDVTVNGGTLAGSGTIDGLVTIDDGILSPGNSPGLLTMSELDMNGGDYLWQLAALTTTGAGTNFDFVLVDDGNANLSDTANVVLDFSLLPTLDQPSPDNSFWLTDQQWTILSVTGGGVVSGTFGDLNQIVDLGVFGSGIFSLQYDATNVYLNYAVAAIPEPGSLLLASLGALTLGGLGYRRRKGQTATSED